MLALVEEIMDSAILNNHEIRPSSLPRFNEMSFYASRWTRGTGTNI